jgi:hypothetical protein
VIGDRPLRVLLAATVCFAIAETVPRIACGWDASAYYSGDLAAQDALARAVIRSVNGATRPQFYATGSARFDGQSAIAIYQMAILGLGQIVLEHPEKRAEYLPTLLRAADRLVDPATHPYAAQRYGRSGLVPGGAGQAYLGYVNLALSMLRLVDPNNRHAALNDRMTEELARRLDASRTGLIETYPGETWPPDVAAVAGSIGLHSRATHRDRSELLTRWSKRFAQCALDRSGYLVQRVASGGCKPLDAPRGSGTAIASYFIAFADPDLSRRLESALRSEGLVSLFGFAAINEYAHGHSGYGDVNAGPVVMGVSVGATGFALGAARINGDEDLFERLYRTAHFFGTPVDGAGTRDFASGGALGNALLLAMLTARRP